MNKIIVGFVIIVIIAAGAAWWFLAERPGEDGEEIKTELIDFTYDGANRRFVATGRNLGRVDVLGVPAGDGEVALTEYEKLGKMTIDSEDEIQTWVLPVPKYPLPISEIIAVAYDQMDAEAGRMSLAIIGETEIYNTLWLEIPFEEAVLSVGESFTTENLTLKLVDIAEDSRCPAGVECIQAGRVTVDVETTLDGKTSMISLKSDEGERTIGEVFFVNIVKIEPPAREGRTLAATDYEITFYITKEIKKL